jgi:hypothetical protein
MISQQYRSAAPAPAARALEPRTIAERMADAMREMRAAGQIVTAATLAVYGDFTDDEVAIFGPEAANLARSREVRQVA